MQRIVYAPKAYAFIKDQDGNTHDISSYIVSGQVTRKVDQVSTAELTLRNPKMIFTSHTNEDGVVSKPLFHPMDPITIYLQRLKGHPVRVFTGFLDEAPYINLYPGPVTLRASCTLKRIIYSYFDPSLPYTISFIENYGWLTTPDGQIVSQNAYNQGAENPEQSSTKQSNDDGSFSNIIFATLKHIGQWSPASIYIENIPENLFKRLSEIANEFDKNNEEAKNEIKDIFARIAGTGAYTAPSDIDISTTGDAISFDQVAALAESVGLPGVTFAQIAKGESGLRPKAIGHDPGGTIGIGLWQITTKYNDDIIEQFGGREALLDPHTNAIAAKAIYDRQGIGAWYGTKYITGDNLHYHGPTSSTPSQDLPSSSTGGSANSDTTTSRSENSSDKKGDQNGTRFQAIVAEANRMTDLANNGLKYNQARPPSDTQGYDCSSSVSKILYTAGYKPRGGYAWANTDSIVETYGIQPGKDPSGRLTIWNKTIAQAGADQAHVWAEINGRAFTTADSKSGHFKDGYYAIDNPAANGFTPYHMNGLDDPASIPADADLTTGGSAGATNSASTLGATFFGALEFPGLFDTAAAALITGDKSLINDKPLMPFIQQLCNASLRHFQSIPDGRFYAFFPDYFGEINHHAPYWEIDDVEIINGSVSITDDSLVTHMYVVGDVQSPMGGETPFPFRSVFSSGVVTIFNAFMSDSVINRTASRKENQARAEKEGSKREKEDDWIYEDPAGMGILIDRDEAAGVLERYGARPLVEDMPMIKSPYYEMFIAYQHFMLSWAKQFSTPFTFTFMPELFPGGKVGFPNHGIQMYIEEVTHSIDYESGFATVATLSAPSVYGKNTKIVPPNMVKALIEPSRPEKKTKQNTAPPKENKKK